MESFETIVENIDTCKWPTECRNCGWAYPNELKRIVSGRLRTEGSKSDLLKIVSSCLLAIDCSRYCCINNYRPTLHQTGSQVNKLFDPNRYVVIRKNIIVERGMTGWLDITWDDDDEDDEDRDEELAIDSGVISLFNS